MSVLKIRSDLEGVVFIDGVQYAAGDSLPDGVVISSSLLEPEAASTKRNTSKTAAVRSKGE